ncbi:hypothetical protein [Pedobacter jejuensis]|uniref:Uncharacterized protein n=1 Tax=Pedobacter jejuensis TaxID=1268550 RepID=A0A3N0BWJ1_9SPHI|nr:hypothetical protein [Pedobacter jejuensis]RNL53354.1 hypothetical protein D7004_09730 [Pedobacter jejuensis]
MSRHTDFILSPITSILQEVVYANSCIGNGIETYPLSDYILQAVFLKMTGFQEQKMKCICWDIATNDYEYRYDRYSNKTLGECSKFAEKNMIYIDLLKQIKKYNPSFVLATEINKVAIQTSTIDFIREIFTNSNLSSIDQRSLLEFLTDNTILNDTQFLEPTALLQTELQEKYKQLYTHRNRSAHNTQSYQENLPTLTTLFDKKYKYDNYFVRFAILILIDTIFIELYNIYLDGLKENFV